MCCFFTSLFLLGPRVAGFVWWAFQPNRWDAAFSTWLWPALGVVFVPWTTMAYVLVASAGVHGFDWFWIVLGVLADISFWTGGAWGNRDRIPGSSSAA